jgi:hypothetical protein
VTPDPVDAFVKLARRYVAIIERDVDPDGPDGLRRELRALLPQIEAAYPRMPPADCDDPRDLMAFWPETDANDGYYAACGRLNARLQTLLYRFELSAASSIRLFDFLSAGEPGSWLTDDLADLENDLKIGLRGIDAGYPICLAVEHWQLTADVHWLPHLRSAITLLDRELAVIDGLFDPTSPSD